MQIWTMKDYDAMSQKAADLFIQQIEKKPGSVMGLATGSTPEGMYALLADKDTKCPGFFAGITTFNLDEYFPIDDDNDQSYHYFMNHHLFSKIQLDKGRIHVPDGHGDPEAVCAAYEKMIEAAGGVDLQILGIGHNGHIGFNEPDEIFSSATHVTGLTESTIQANARFFASADLVPKQAITMGVKTIMKSRTILLMASGRAKAEIIKKALFGPITPKVPASALQLHPCVHVVLDEEAAALLSK